LRQTIFKALTGACLLLLTLTGCVELPSTTTGEAVLYIYDGTSRAILSWDDLPAIYDGGSASAASRTITSGKLTGLSLGWGGMALDRSNGYLYLVSSAGTVVRISRIGSQSGAVSSGDAISFTLDDAGTDAEAGGVFGQAAVNPVGNTLYVTESDPSSGKSQIWAIPSSLMFDGATFTKDTATLLANTSLAGGTSDKNCTGVAASSTALYGYFDTGGTINPSGTDHTGSRLRKGTPSGSFPATSSVIVGQSGNAVTLLGKYGNLAYDTGNDYLYLARHVSDSGIGGNPLLVYSPGTFSPGLETGPDRSLAGPSDLRILAHAGDRDWLAGARSPATHTLWIWKAPSAGDTSVSVALPDTTSGTVQIQGLALDGSN
jgi:hypothetical protein